MMSKYNTILILINSIMIARTSASLLDQLQYYSSQSAFTAQVFQSPFSMENVVGPSLDLALRSCQESFRWQPWNCPASDFYRRRNIPSQHWDSEDAYVTAINTAAILYTIAKNCSSGVVSDCGCQSMMKTTIPPRSNDLKNGGSAAVAASNFCSDIPHQAEQLYEQHMRLEFKRDFYGSAQRHNYRAVTQLLRKSLVRECGCHSVMPGGICLDEPQCRDVLPPFAEIAGNVRRLYDEALQVGSGARLNSKVLWCNVPLDALVYIRDAPNYCEPDAVPLWHGMQGRQCSYGNGEESSDYTDEESNSCERLCSACSLGIRSKNVVVERACNCHFTPWTFQVNCERCMSVEQTFHCY